MPKAKFKRKGTVIPLTEEHVEPKRICLTEPYTEPLDSDDSRTTSPLPSSSADGAEEGFPGTLSCSTGAEEGCPGTLSCGTGTTTILHRKFKAYLLFSKV